MKILNFLFLTFLLPVCLSAQSATDNWTFHNNPGDGWFSVVVEGLDGHIFAGGGLPNSNFREYDGNTWTLYNAANTNAPVGFFGRDLAVDGNGLLWISPGNQNGVSSWDGQNMTNYSTASSDIISNSNFGVATDQNNVLWTTSLQSFDGTNWETYSHNDCYHGGMRQVFVDSHNTVWISGIYGIGIESGILSQPCVFRIADGVVTNFHLENGDNLPELFGGYHLMGELSDGTLFMAGRTINGIELKTFDGENWQDWETYTGPDTGISFWGMWVDENDNILLGGQKNETTAQIAKFCQGNWTFYDLPEADGFPSIIFDVMVDSQSRLWITGDIGLASVPYAPTACLTTDVEDTETVNESALALHYEAGYLSIWPDSQTDAIATINLYDALGRQVGRQQWTGSPAFVGLLPAGMYVVGVEFKSGRVVSEAVVVGRR